MIGETPLPDAAAPGGESRPARGPTPVAAPPPDDIAAGRRRGFAPLPEPWPGLLLAAAGAVGTWLAHRWLPLPAADPLRSTLAAVPLAVAAFAALHRTARRRGARRIPPGLLRFESGALAGLAAAALARGPLGLTGATPALAAGLLGLAVLHAAAQLRALRPLLGERLAGRPSVLFFAVPAVLYLAILPWAAERRQPDGDEPYYLLLAHSLAYDLDADLANNYAGADWRFFLDRPVAPQPGDPVGQEGQVYSRHNLLLPLALAVPYRLAGKVGVLAAMSLLAALLAWLVLRLAGRFFPHLPGEALLASGVLALAPPLLTYAHQVWVEVPAAVLLALALDRVLDRTAAAHGGAGPRWRQTAGWAALALPLILLPLLKMRFAVVALPLLALAFHRASRGNRRARRGVLGIAVLLATTGGAILAYNRARFGNPLKIHTWGELALPAVSLRGTLEGFLGLFWDVAFGLFAFAPLWLVVVPALALAAARWRGAVGRPAAYLAVVALPYLLLVAPRAEWYGGWSPPFRYGVVLLPLLAVVLVPLLAERHRSGARLVLGALGAATLALALVWLAAPGITYHLADGRTRLLDALSAGLGADAARLFPSYVRPRLASWLWPPLSALAVTLAWWLPRRRRPEAPASARGASASHAVGAALVLVAAASVPALAALLPPRVVELEDPWVIHRGGHVHPETWVVARSHYRGGWVVRPGEAVEVPLGPGAGGRAGLVLELRFGRNNPDPLSLEVLAGDRLLTRWRPRATGVWRRIELGPLDLPPGEPLVLRAAGPPRAGRQNGLLLDRVEIEWL